MGLGGRGIGGMPAAGIFDSATFGDGDITDVGNIALDSLSADGANILLGLGAADGFLIGNSTAIASLTAVTANGANLEHADIDTDTAAGDLVHVISGSGATAGFYRITAVGTDDVTLATAVGGAGSDIVCTIYKDVVFIQATDGTDGQRICGYSHQDKPLVIGGDLAGAGINVPSTSRSLGGEDVLIGGKAEIDGAAYCDSTCDVAGDLTVGATTRITMGGGTNDDGIVFASLGTATKGIDLSSSNLAGSDYYIYNSAGNNWNANGALFISGSLITNDGIGTIVGTGNSGVEIGSAATHRTAITMTNVDIALNDDGNDAYGGLKIYDFPQGWIYFLGIVADIALTKSSSGVNADWDGDVAFGTAVVGDETSPMAGTDEDLVDVTDTPQAVSSVTTADCESTTTEIHLLDGSTGTGAAADVCINFMVDDADHNVAGTACNLICNGTVTITWINLGDN